MQGFKKIKRSLENKIEAVSVRVACTQAHDGVFLSTVSRSLIDIGLERKILLKVDLRKHSVIVWPGSICRQAYYSGGLL
jgi:hypothetical protein